MAQLGAPTCPAGPTGKDRYYAFPVEDPKPFCKWAACNWAQNDEYGTPTTCFEAKNPTQGEGLDIAVLYAEGMNKIAHEIYPEEISVRSDFSIPYDEPLYPIPVGASVYYFVMLAWMLTFYYTYLGRKLLFGVKQKLDLHPEANHFPNLPLYWIQQSKREAKLRREVRNTWAWLARRYLLSPNDPLLANVDQVMGLVNWHDFEVSRTTWSLIRVILTVNALYVKVKRDRAAKAKQFEIIRDVGLAKDKSREDDPIQVTRVFEELENGEVSVPAAPKPAKPKPPPPPPKVIAEPKRKSAPAVFFPPPEPTESSLAPEEPPQSKGTSPPDLTEPEETETPMRESYEPETDEHEPHEHEHTHDEHEHPHHHIHHHPHHHSHKHVKIAHTKHRSMTPVHKKQKSRQSVVKPKPKPVIKVLHSKSWKPHEPPETESEALDTEAETDASTGAGHTTDDGGTSRMHKRKKKRRKKKQTDVREWRYFYHK